MVAEVDDRVLVHIGTLGLLGLGQVHAVVVVQGIGADQGVDESLHLRQAERIAQSGAFGPSLLKGGYPTAR